MSQQLFGRAYGGSAPENYERYFVPTIGAPLAADLITTAALRPGERVLDVACGTGIVARLAKERVGPTGTVTGLDLNPGMLAVARSVTPPSLSIAWYEASAEAMPLPDEAFDVVLSQAGLQFVPDKPATLREMRRVLMPGGRLAISVPGPMPPLFAIVEEALEHHLGPEAAGMMRMVFSLHDPAALGNHLNGAGFQDVDVQPVAKTLRLPPPEEFLWQYIQSTPLVAFVAMMEDQTRTALEREVVARQQQFVKEEALILELGIVVATARK